MNTPTTPIRHPAPNPAPNRPSECPRCGAPAISTKGVGAHDLWHRQQDDRDRRHERVLTALEEMLSAFDGDPSDDPDEGEPKTFRAWVAETDHILDTITGQLDDLQHATQQPAPAVEAAEIEVLPWPGDPGPAGIPNPAEQVLTQQDDGTDGTADRPTTPDDDWDDDAIDLPNPSRF